MKWWRILAKFLWFLNRVTPFEFVRVIKDREADQDYLVRYYLFSTRWIAPVFPKLSYRLTLHNTLRSDIDGLHDHPWNWKSKILEGGYDEYTPEGVFWREPSQGWRSRTANDYHRLVIRPDKMRPGEQTWSLFLMGPRVKDWGFLSRNNTWVQWEEYISNREYYI